MRLMPQRLPDDSRTLHSPECVTDGRITCGIHTRALHQFVSMLPCQVRVKCLTSKQQKHPGAPSAEHPGVHSVGSSCGAAADNLLFEAPLTRCRLRRGTRHTGVRCMVFIDPEKSLRAGNLGHVSCC